MEIRKCLDDFWSTQKSSSILLRLFCIWKKHISSYNILKNRSFDKIKILWPKKRGGTTLKRGGGNRPLSPPPPKSALVTCEYNQHIDQYYSSDHIITYTTAVDQGVTRHFMHVITTLYNVCYPLETIRFHLSRDCHPPPPPPRITPHTLSIQA